MISHTEISPGQLRQLIRKSSITAAGNAKLKIFGKLGCRTGKQMNRVNRVFFTSEEEAVRQNFRPCGHCMKTAYNQWKNESVQ